MIKDQATTKMSCLTQRRYPAEVLDRILYLTGKINSTGTISVVIYFDDQLDFARLQDAALRLLSLEPILAARFVPHWWHAYWEIFDAKVLSSTLVTIIESENLEDDLDVIIGQPLLAEEAPQFRVTLLRKEQRGDVLIIKVNHAAADGLSTQRIVYRLAELYRQSEPETKHTISRLESDRRSLAPVFDSMTHDERKELLRRIRHAVRLIRRLPRTTLLTDPNPEMGSGYVLRKIPAEQCAQLDRYCRQREISLTTLVAAAAYRGIGQLLSSDRHAPVALALTVDLRRAHLADPKTLPICNYSVPMRLDLSSPADTELLTLAREIRQAVNWHRGRFWGLALPVLFLATPRGRWLDRLLPFGVMKYLIKRAAARLASRRPPIFGLGNVGNLDEKRLQFGPNQPTYSISLPPILRVNGILLSMSWWQGACSLVMGFFSPLLSKRQAEAVLDFILMDLSATLDNHDRP